MALTILVWLLVIFYGFYIGGHAFNFFVSLPNWDSGNLEDVHHYQQFYRRAKPKRYFRLFMFLTPALAIAVAAMVWDQSQALNVFSTLATGAGIISLIFTELYFIPIIRFIENPEEHNEEQIKRYSRMWAMGDIIRIIIIAVGFLCSIRLIELIQPLVK